MSNRDPRQRFDYQNWLNSQVAERAKASLTARDAAFAENNAGVTRAALTQYLNVCAAALGHSPSPTEIDGGAFIEQRFGSWDNAMTAAGLPRPKTTPKLNNTLRYRMEKEKLLERKTTDGNRRSYHIFLTPKGKTLCEIIRQEFMAIEYRALDGFTSEEKQLLNTYLDRIHANMKEGL